MPSSQESETDGREDSKVGEFEEAQEEVQKRSGATNRRFHVLCELSAEIHQRGWDYETEMCRRSKERILSRRNSTQIGKGL